MAKRTVNKAPPYPCRPKDRAKRRHCLEFWEIHAFVQASEKCLWSLKMLSSDINYYYCDRVMNTGRNRRKTGSNGHFQRWERGGNCEFVTGCVFIFSKWTMFAGKTLSFA